MTRCCAWLLCAALLLAGCGQRGGLYLPDQHGTAVPKTPPETSTKSAPPEPAANPADEDKKKTK